MTFIAPTRKSIASTLERIERTAAPLNTADRGALPADVHALGVKWIENFIMKPHPDLGRSGAICPFVQSAYMSGSIYATALDVNHLSFPQFIQLMIGLPDVYKNVMAAHKISPLLFSLVVFLPNLAEDKYSRFIDLTQAMMKPVFMNAGLMLGEFHPASRTTGVHSDRIFPMRAAVPSFVIRAIAPHDSLFIDGENSPTAFRIHELECYLAWAKVPLKKQRELKARIDALKLGTFLRVAPEPSVAEQGAIG